MKDNYRNLTVSYDAHTLLFIVQGRLQSEQGKRVTLDETVLFLVNHYDSDLANRLEVKE